MSPDDQWRTACERAAVVVPGPDNLIAAGELLRATAYSLAGVACPRCNGFGVKTYGSTAVWTGGVGAQSLTEAVCDKCWGTGRKDKTGVNQMRVLLETIRKPASKTKETP